MEIIAVVTADIEDSEEYSPGVREALSVLRAVTEASWHPIFLTVFPKNRGDLTPSHVEGALKFLISSDEHPIDGSTQFPWLATERQQRALENRDDKKEFGTVIVRACVCWCTMQQVCEIPDDVFMKVVEDAVNEEKKRIAAREKPDLEQRLIFQEAVKDKPAKEGLVVRAFRELEKDGRLEPGTTDKILVLLKKHPEFAFKTLVECGKTFARIVEDDAVDKDIDVFFKGIVIPSPLVQQLEGMMENMPDMLGGQKCRTCEKLECPAHPEHPSEGKGAFMPICDPNQFH